MANFVREYYVDRMADECCASKGKELEKLARQSEQRQVLITVLAINAVMFAIEFGGGLWAGSAALMADSVDMLGDALVYGVSLYALARTDRWKAGAAVAKGGFILMFGLGVLWEIVAKIKYGVPPASGLMIAFGFVALAANLICLRLLWRYRNQDVNMSSTFECSRNDVAANVGVIVAAALVWAFASPWPDIVVALVIALLFLRSAISVLREAVPQLKAG